ncbi:MAG: SpoVR family protein [Clostridia bacterium]|nr:SpoVR family protein [Clostridia bacterium]
MLFKRGEMDSRIGAMLELAQREGLDGYPVIIEECSPETLYGMAAAGVPGRFIHWSFGKKAEALVQGHRYGRHRLYELAIYGDPCYGFLSGETTSGEKLLLIAHLIAHSDFFKNNSYFQANPPPAPELFSRRGEEIEEYEKRYGSREVELFLDAVLSVKELFQGAGPSEKDRDLLGFLQAHSPVLVPWQRRVLDIIKEEMKYYWPQVETRILNEGWASFWHRRLLAACCLTEGETVDAARLHAQLLAPGPAVNPYLAGKSLLERILREEGMAALFAVRTLHNDYSFVRRYMKEDLLEQLDIYLYDPKTGTCVNPRENWEQVKKTWLSYLENGGYPTIYIEDPNYLGEGVLYLRHSYQGLSLDRELAQKTLEYVEKLWGAPVFLETVFDGQRCILQSNYC